MTATGPVGAPDQSFRLAQNHSLGATHPPAREVEPYDGREEPLGSDLREESTQSAGLVPAPPPQLTELIARVDLASSSPIIDIGGGDSTLVDDLTAKGYEDITVLDVSPAALGRARARLGTRAEDVHWIETDLLQAQLLPRHYALWHDRALFHFFIQEAARATYLPKLVASLAPGGRAIIATFATDGPTECSGLPTQRYGPRDILHLLGQDFELEASLYEDHSMPSGAHQRFAYAMLRSSP